MNKIMNGADRFVDDSLAGLVAAHPELVRLVEGEKRGLIRTGTPEKGKVAIVTGGGFGHLPVFLGYVGDGLCDGCAVGNVFTTPSCESIVETAKAVNGGAGVLFLYANYMGDTMNFEMAAEMLDMEDIPCRLVKISDDMASAPREDCTERRGVAGLVFAYKIAGALAARGASLDEVADMAQSVCGDAATLGIAMSSCQLPGAPHPIFQIGEDEMELGMGIHGEPGVRRTKLMTSAELAKLFAEKLLGDLSLSAEDEVSVLVNSLGATSLEELYILYGDLARELAAAGIRVFRVYVGRYAASMEMQGASISLLRMKNEYKALLSDPAHTPFFKF